MRRPNDHPEQTVGVVLVHGIGRQKLGESTARFVRALSHAYRTELPNRKEGNATVVELPGRSVRFYEACWSDVLTDEAVAGSFSAGQILELSWFPWLNLRAHLYEPPPRLRVLTWTIVLAPAAIGLLVLWLVAVLAAACLRVTGKLSAMFDQVIADVLNYVNSAGHATDRDSPLCEVATRVEQRFDQALDQAASDGCTYVHVVAHSLGTVIAARRLFGTQPLRTRGLVTRLYTIGSPVRRVRFLWPRLFENVRAAPQPEWINYWDRLDLISSRLRPEIRWCHVDDVALTGRAGLGHAHMAYVAHPRFVDRFADGVGAVPPPKHRQPAGTFILAASSLLESLFVLLMVLAALILGLILCLFGAIISSVVGALSIASESGVSGHDYWSTAQLLFLILLGVWVVGYFVLFPIGYGRFKAGYGHRRHLYPHRPQAACSAEKDDEQSLGLARESEP
jgi:hypothetical protein